MKRSLLLVFVVLFAFIGLFSLATLLAVPEAQAVPLDSDTIAAPPLPPPPVNDPTAITADPYIALVKSPTYYDAANVSIENVTSFFVDEYEAWDRYQLGEFDTIGVPGDLVATVEGSPHASELYVTPKLATTYYGFSADVAPMDNALLRAALATALDRAQLISAAPTMGGYEQPTLTFTPPGAFGYVDGYATGVGHPYSPTLALDLLAASGYTGSPTITLMTNDSPNRIAMADAARQMWIDTLGVTVTVEVMDWVSYIDLLHNGDASERPGIFCLGWGADYPDAYNFLYDALIGGPNPEHYDNPNYNAVLAAAAAELDPVARADLYRQAESYLVMTDTAISPIYSYVNYDVTRDTLNRTYRQMGQHLDEWSFASPESLELTWGEPDSLDPAFGYNDYIEQLFLGLTDYDPVTNEAVPELATGWEVSPDAMVYTFTLRSDAFWTDGNPVTAYDAAYGVNRSMTDPDSFYGEYLAMRIQAVTPLDATHVRFDLHEPAVYFPALVAMPAARPQPQWAIEMYGSDWTRPENIVSNGPYELAAWVAAPHLRIDMIGSGPPAEGGNTGFHIQYWNDGGLQADNVTIEHTLEYGTVYLMDTSGFPVSGSGMPGDPLVWDVGPLPPYSFGEFELFLGVTAVQSEMISNTVYITTTTPDDQSQLWERKVGWNDIVVANDTHLSVNKWLEDPFIAPGQDITYGIDVCNGFPQGSSASTPVVITDILPSELTLQSWWSDGNYWYDDSGSAGQNLVLERPSVPGYWCDTIKVMAHVAEGTLPGTQIDNTAVITASSDLEPGDNQSSYNDLVVNYTDLALTMSGDPDPVMQGQPLTYTLTVYNNGPLPASDVIITDTLPVGAVVANMPGNCADMGAQVVCTLGSVPYPGNAFVDIVVIPTQAGTAVNAAEVKTVEFETYPIDNFASLSTIVAPASTDPLIFEVMPDYGFNDQATSITILGYNFQPGALVYLDDISLPGVVFVNDTELQVDVPPGLLPGTYDVWVENPDAGTAVLLNGFTVLQNQPPQVTAVTPSQGPDDIPVTIDIFGSNFAGGSSATLQPGYIPLNAVFVDDTHLRAVVPSFLATGTYTVQVDNPDESSDALPDAYEIIDAATNTDLYADPSDMWNIPYNIRLGDPTTPQIGLNVRRLGGAAALPSVSVDFFLGAPNGDFIGQSDALLLSPNSSQSTIPLDWSPPGVGTFTLYAVIDPADSVTETIETNNTVSRTITVLPPSPADDTPPDIIEFIVNDGAPSANSPQVTLNITATDAESGATSVLYIEYEYDLSGGGWVPVQVTDWLSYTEASVAYPWALLPSPGLHYLQAWVADEAGNISVPALQFINYQPDVIPLSAGQVHVYRENLMVGDGRQVRLTSLDGGTMDFYVWAPDATLVELHEGVNGFAEIVFTADQDGVYQIEVEGQTNAQYQLEIISAAPGVPQTSNRFEPDEILRARDRPFMLPDDEPDDGVGLPLAPTNSVKIMLPIVLRN